ncbi:unnamed protein product [marine sediment metagenome]|uniref:Glyoxalase-like domain-containing protein n=1 Tax=marine sediment metagenome TaxID=412755 RepID=X1GIT1_9ZZZZ
MNNTGISRDTNVEKAVREILKSRARSRIYTYLLRKGGVRTKKIIKGTHLHPSTVRETLSKMYEQPWGQRCFRIYDPDNHIIEFGEPMPTVIKRFSSQGLSIEEIVKKTLMPLEIVKKVLGK